MPKPKVSASPKDKSKIKPIRQGSGELSRTVQNKPLTMADLLDRVGEMAFSFRRGQQVEGTVVAVSPREVLLDIGGKSEAVVAEREMAYISDITKNLKIGDKIAATVVVPENDAGQVVVSLRRGMGSDRWQRLSDAAEKDEVVTAFGVEVNRGGILLDFEGIRGFLPASQADLGGARLDDWIGKKITVRVLDADQKGGRLIFTQKVSSSAFEAKNTQQALSKIEVGGSYKGEIVSLLPFGVFVRFTPKGGEVVEGLVHVSELAWSKIADPAEVYKVGDKTTVKVLSKDDKNGRLALSVKQMTEDPWTKGAADFKAEQEVSGKVSRLSPFGAFVELAPGIEGLIHISKIPPDFSINAGDKISCVVESVDQEARRIALSPILKQKPVLYR